MSSSRDRHDRESAAKAARAAGGSSREYVRQAKVVTACAPELMAEVSAGRTNLNAAYRQVTGDDRVPLFLKLDKDIDEGLRLAAAESGMSRQQMVLTILRQRFG